MTQRHAIAVMLAACALTIARAAPTDPSKSTLKFVFSEMGVSVESQFKRFDADVAFDPAHLAQAHASVTVDLASADTGSSDADDALRTAAWFDTPRFPRATFAATQFKPLGAGRYQALGRLTLKGMAANVTVPFTARVDAGGQWLEGAFALSRLAWKVGTGEWADVGSVADAVEVKFKLFVPRNAAPL